MTTKRECAHCGERFSLAQRSGRDTYRARAGREPTYQEGQRYCSANCRKAASKARRTRSETPVTEPITRPATPIKASQATYTCSGVAHRPNPINLAIVSRASKSTRPALQMDFGGYTVIPDTDWPAMYRVRRPDGSLTDMANLTRARDAARQFADQAQRQPLAEAA